jgi:hypothetical protein
VRSLDGRLAGRDIREPIVARRGVRVWVREDGVEQLAPPVGATIARVTMSSSVTRAEAVRMFPLVSIRQA